MNSNKLMNGLQKSVEKSLNKALSGKALDKIGASIAAEVAPVYIKALSQQVVNTMVDDITAETNKTKVSARSDWNPEDWNPEDVTVTLKISKDTLFSSKFSAVNEDNVGFEAWRLDTVNKTGKIAKSIAIASVAPFFSTLMTLYKRYVTKAGNLDGYTVNGFINKPFSDELKAAGFSPVGESFIAEVHISGNELKAIGLAKYGKKNG